MKKKVFLFLLTFSSFLSAQEGMMTCNSCSGTGVLNCGGCGGTGTTACFSCGGVGQTMMPQIDYYTGMFYSAIVNCHSCNGTGKQNCFYCQGKGGNRCNYCDGSGFKSNPGSELAIRKEKTYVDPNCKACGGKGTVTCVPCFGTGMIQGFVTHDCSLCTGGRIQCHACKAAYENEIEMKKFQKMTPEEQERYLMNKEHELRMSQEFLDIVQDGIDQRNSLRQQEHREYYENKRAKQNQRTMCVSCGGTGVNPKPMPSHGASSWVAHFHSGNGSRCQYCNQLDSHFHDRCSSCNTPGY